MPAREIVADAADIMYYAWHGNMPPIGDLSQVDAVMGFAFGVHFDSHGRISDPGPSNKALAHFLLHHAIRDRDDVPWYLQEELAIAVAQDPSADQAINNRIINIGSLKKPGKTYNTDELISRNENTLQAAGQIRVADLSFPYHAPRTAANLHAYGFQVATFDLPPRQVDFDPGSSQAQVRSIAAWRRREMPAIGWFAMQGKLKLPETARQHR